MTRLFTLFLLLFATTYLSAQTPLFQGKSLKSNFEDSPELQYQFKEFDVYQIDVQSFNEHVKGAGDYIEFHFQLGNDYDWEINLWPLDLRKPGYLRRWATADGIKTVPPSENLTFRGEVEAPGGGSVSMTVDDELIKGFVKKDGIMYFIEPVWYFIKGEAKDLFVVYAASDVQPREDAMCGYTAMLDKTPKHEHPHDHEHPNDDEHPHEFEHPNDQHPNEYKYQEDGHGFEKSVACKEVEIAIASDWLMYDHFGSASAVEAFETGVLADVQTNFDDEFDDELFFTIVEFFTVTQQGGDPWSGSNNASTLLTSFSNWGNSGGFGATFDVAGLWTDRNFNNNVIGIAYLNGICNSRRYHCLQNFSGNANLLRVLWAHELGHNFSCTHDPTGSGTIMAPSVNNTNAWSNQSINQVNAYVPTRGCLAGCGGILPPVADFSANPTQGCVPLVVQFTDLSQNIPFEWEWTFPGGDPSSSNEPNPVVTYNTPGVYNVTLKVTNSAGSDEITFPAYIEVEDVPIPSFTFIQIGLDVIFTNTSISADSYLWDFGDGNSSTEEHPFHSYLVDDFYDVTLTAFNDCGSEIYTFTIPVFNPPTAGFTADPTIGCSALDVQFTSQSSANTLAWNWVFSGGTPGTSMEENPMVTFASPGVYDVTLTVANPAGTDTFSITDYITVGTIAIPDFSFTVSGDTAWFTNESNNSGGVGTMTYLWEFGDGDTSTAENPQHIYSSNGTFDVELTVTNDCGDATIIKQVTILTAPIAGFSAPETTGCEPFTVTFNDESSGNPTSWDWDFPGGSPSSSTDENPTVTYNTPGSYDVTLIVSNSVGSDTITINDYITVDPLAVAGFSSSVNGLTASFTNNSTNATSYNWDFGDNNNSTETNPTHTYADDGTYTVQLIATNDCGSDTTTQTVVVITSPSAGFSADVTSGCAALTVQFTNQSSSNATSFDWSFPGGDPSSSTDENPTVTYNSPGTYDVTLIVSNAAGSDTMTITNYIDVSTVPTAGYSSSANGLTVSFTNNSTGATSYNWDFGDNNSSTETDPTHTYDEDGEYEVVLTATNDCGSVTDTQIVIVVTAPSAGFSANTTSGCDPLTVQYTNQSSPNATSFDWDFPGGNPSSSTDENPTVTYNSPGTYDVTLIATNAAGSDTITMTNFIDVNTVPTPGFDVSTNVFVAIFTNTTTNGTSYHWDFGDTNTSTEANPTHTYQGDGTYTVELIAFNACGSDTITQIVVITSLPQANFSADETTGCAPFTVQFMDQSSSNTTSWEWDFPGGSPSSSTDQNPIVTYDDVGTYEVSLTAINSLGQDSETKTNYINVITTPTPDFSSTSNMLVVNFTNNSSGATSYEWDFGDNTNSTEANPSHTYDEDGSYEVTLTATNQCGSVTTTQTVVVVSAPTAGFSANATNGCAPFEVEFSNQSTANATDFEWEFPGGSPSNSMEENPVVTYSTPGIYDVKLTVSNSAGQSVIEETDYIIVGGLPTASFTADVTGFTADFTNNSTNAPNSGNMTYEWDFGDNNTSTEENPSHTYTEDGTYDVTLIVTNDCGSKTINGQVTVVSVPTAGFSAVQTIGCAPFEVEFMNQSTANAETFEWEFPGGDPATSMEENPVVIYNTPGTYDVILTVTNSAGSNTVTETSYITVGAAPDPAFDFAVTGLDVEFINKSTNYLSVEWDFGDSTTSVENDPMHSYAEDGAYTVTLTTTNECGSTTTTQIVVIATEGPVAAFQVVSQTGCVPYEVTFENLSSANAESFEWTFEGGVPPTSTEENPTVTYADTGSYTVTLIATNSLASDTFEVVDYIIVNNVPTPGFSSVDNALVVTFTNTSTNATSYEWDFGDGQSSTESDPVHEYNEPGEYEVTLTATNECGFNVLSQTVTVMANAVGEIPGISEFNVYPNPNDGRFTMVLRGQGRDDLQVYFTNVLGQVILQSEIDFRSGNATREFSFHDLAAGVYIFQIRSGNNALYRKLVVD